MATAGGTRTLGAELDNRSNININQQLTISKAGADHINSGNIIANQDVIVTQSGAAPSFTNSGAIIIANTKLFTVNGGTFNMNAGTNLSGSGTLQVSSGSVFSANSTVTVPSSLTFALSSGTLQGTGDVVINGTFNWTSGTITGAGDFINNGTLSINSGGAKYLNGRKLTNNGTVNLNNSFYTYNSAVISNQAGGLFDIRGNYTVGKNDASSPVFNNAGTLQMSSGVIATIGFPLNNSNILDIQTGTLDLAGYTFTNTGTLTGNGRLNVFGATVNNNGTVSPGASAGKLSITGDFPQSSVALLDIEIGGTTVQTQYDQLAINGEASLDGTLNVTLINSFAPSAGDSFQVVTYTSLNAINNRFTTLNLPSLPAGLQWDPVAYNANDVTISVSNAQHTLTVSKTGSGTGTVTSDTGVIDCGSTCSDTYNHGTVVTLTATPDAGASFTGWSGDADCADGIVTMDADRSCTADFSVPCPLAPLNVTSTADAVDASIGDGYCDDGTGNCTLRAAIQEANACAGADIITLPAGTYILAIAGTGEDAAATGDLDITDELTITGAGAATTVIDGGAIDRVLHTQSAAVTIDAVTIRNGRLIGTTCFDACGAGVLTTGGSLTITDSAIDSNSASGSDVGNAGGIYCTSCTLTITNSTISNNTASGPGWSVGGGILKTGSGTTTITNTTISGNSAGYYGGGFCVNAAVSTFTNVTITNNSASGGAGLYARNSGTQVTLINSIVANQVGGGDCLTVNGASPVSALSDSIDSDGSCGGATTANPMLSGLADNGGPTQTHALQAGSPAIDAGDNASCPATDQRGTVRSDGVCDIGAYEFP
jgi:CSLREA domain-containing protein